MNPLNTDAVICLCLDKRETLWRKLESQCLEKGWDFKPFICGSGDGDFQYNSIDQNAYPPMFAQSTTYPTWTKRVNAYNAWQSHKAMIEYSLKEGYESVAFIEDDLGFFPDFDVKFKEVENCYPDDWQLFYIGNFCNNVQRHDYWGENIIQVHGNCCGFHFVCLKRAVLERLSKFPPLGPFDHISQHYIQTNTMCYAIYPPIAKQLPAHSFIEGHWLGRREEDNYQ